MAFSLVSISNFNLRFGQKLVFSGLDWTVEQGENWLLCGESGAGKSILLKAIAGIENRIDDITLHFHKTSACKAVAHYVAQWYQFKNVEGVANFYYQQRYNKQQYKDTLSVSAELAQFGKENELADSDLHNLVSGFNFEQQLATQLIELSSGEHKKLQLIKALWLKPQLLLLDQPYTGLDVKSRAFLNDTIDGLSNEMQVILVSNESELPACINRFASIGNHTLKEDFTYCAKSKIAIHQQPLPQILREAPVPSSQTLVNLVNVSIRYGDKQVLNNINWEIKAGEKWLLKGPNGSGKSTLLSLINADHPQSYANEIYLFGNRRGTGESIWDIKKHIGLISPELHWYFDFNASVWQSIASGYFDSIGLYREIGYQKEQEIDELIAYFGLAKHRDELLAHLPLGKQRLALLARTMIKNPELLVLDEPCQGLDAQQTVQFNTLIDSLCDANRTIIYVSHSEDQLPKNLTHELQLETGITKYIGKYKGELELV